MRNYRQKGCISVRLLSIQLQQFRNYESLSASFGPGVNFLIGRNAQGKTNLLEAIFCLALTKSHRTHVDSQLIQWEKPWANIQADIDKKYGRCNLGITWLPKGKKTKINGLDQRKISDFVGMCNVVLFAPEDLELVKGAPAMRRRFLDMELGQIQPAYLHALSRYHSVLTQRNQLLKQWTSHGMISKEQLSTQLDVWDAQLIQYGIEVMQRRQKFVMQLTEWAKKIHQGITNGLETLAIQYESAVPGMAPDQWEKTLIAQRDRELRQGTTLSGPHRDDLTFQVNGQSVQLFGSQGQQRTTALSLKLAEMELIHQEIGEYPIVLLDDVLSELDPFRQTQLLETVQKHAQVFITTTSIEGVGIQKMNEPRLFDVTDGQIVAR